jgi:methionine-rich copper-binding protein CopC
MKRSTMAIAAVLALAPVMALAHAHLDRAEPAAGAAVAAMPTEVTLSFTEAVEPTFSSIVVHDAQGRAVHDGKATGTPGNTAGLKVKLRPAPPGVYKVMWKVLSVDTHRTQGSFTFTVGR